MQEIINKLVRDEDIDALASMLKRLCGDNEVVKNAANLKTDSRDRLVDELKEANKVIKSQDSVIRQARGLLSSINELNVIVSQYRH